MSNLIPYYIMSTVKNVITKIKLDKWKRPSCKVNGVKHFAFKIGQLPYKDFAGERLTEWVNYNGYILINSDECKYKDLIWLK